ncbi:MAG TPA: pirin family protein [Steroidobacteraceae bacterium]
MLERVIDQRRRDLGGFEVGRVLPSGARRMVGPFIFFDHLGPVDFPKGVSRSVDVRPHPHIGLATVTYLFDGEIMHRDSLGSEQPIRPGEVNWMTAGLGITHSERFEKARAEGDRIHAIQSWVALPVEHEEGEPTFVHYGRESLPDLDARGCRARLLAGAAYGRRAEVATLSPLFYLHCELAAGGEVELPAEYPERAAYVVDGEIECSGQRFAPGKMLVFRPRGAVVLRAERGARVMLLGGEPVGERFIEWNFVASSKDRIERAKAEWRSGRMPLPPGDAEEHIPLPSESAETPNPMS